MSPAPTVSIGLPVHNGQEFLSDCIESLLGQSFEDMEIIICDNASTDETPDICRKYMRADRRIRFHHSERNHGAAWNFNRSFLLARGEYFKWAAHDDVCEKSLVSSCLEVLRSDRRVVLCYCREAGIDHGGRLLGPRPYRIPTAGAAPHERFGRITGACRGSPPIFGLMRTEDLRRTGLIGRYDGADLVLLAELSLLGRFHEVPRELLLHREHPRRSVYAYRCRHQATTWFDTASRNRLLLPAWRMLREYVAAMRRCHLSQKSWVMCCLHLLRWGMRKRGVLAEDVLLAAKAMVREAVIGKNAAPLPGLLAPPVAAPVRAAKLILAPSA